MYLLRAGWGVHRNTKESETQDDLGGTWKVYETFVNIKTSHNGDKESIGNDASIFHMQIASFGVFI